MQSSASSDCSARSDYDSESSVSENEYFDIKESKDNPSQISEENALYHFLENYKMPSVLRGNKSQVAKRGRGSSKVAGNSRRSGRITEKVLVPDSEEPVSEQGTAKPVSLSPFTGSLYNITSETSPGEISIIINSLNAQVNNLTTQLELRLKEFEKRNEFIAKPQKPSTTELKKLQKEIKEVKTRNEEIYKKNREIEEKMELLQQQFQSLNTKNTQREIPNSKKLVLAGAQIDSILENSNFTNLKHNIDEFLIRHLELPRDSLRDVKYARLSDGSKKVSAIIPEYNLIGSFFTQARLLKPQGISISEFLTPGNAFLKYKLLKFRHEGQYGILSVFSFKGEIYIKKEVNGRKIKIKHITDITGTNTEENITTAESANSQNA